MKTSTILTAALIAVGGFVAYKAFANLPSPAEARLNAFIATKNASAADVAQMKASWANVAPADRAVLDRFVTASDKATNAAEMTAAMTEFGAATQAAQQDPAKKDFALVSLAIFLSYTDKRVSFGLPAH